MTVFVVFCRIDGLEEYDRIYATEHGARAYCQQQNARPRYFGRFTFAATQVREETTQTDAGASEKAFKAWIRTKHLKPFQHELERYWQLWQAAAVFGSKSQSKGGE